MFKIRYFLSAQISPPSTFLLSDWGRDKWVCAVLGLVKGRLCENTSSGWSDVVLSLLWVDSCYCQMTSGGPISSHFLPFSHTVSQLDVVMQWYPGNIYTLSKYVGHGEKIRSIIYGARI